MSEPAIVALLRGLHLPTGAMVRRDQRLEHRLRPCYYVEDVDAWSTPWDQAHYSYLYEIVDGRPVTPPRGLRSGVPLGGLGAGGLELRADGSLCDWALLNGSPAANRKVQLPGAFFALRVQEAGGAARAWVLRTHPPGYLPAIDRIEYAGSYPVARLSFADRELPVGVVLHATTRLRLRDALASAQPGALFTFVLDNPLAHGVDVALMLLLPDPLGGQVTTEGGLLLERAGEDLLSGTLAVQAVGEELTVTAGASDDGHGLFAQLAARGRLEPGAAAGTHVALAAGCCLAAGRTRLVHLALAWHLPCRPHAGEVVGHRYAALHRDAGSAARHLLDQRLAAWEGVAAWQRLCFDNSLPGWLQRFLADSLGTLAKTGMWLADGRWRQWESFSCPAVDPVHIHLYRSLPYVFFFPELRRSLLQGYAQAQRPDGYVQENLGDSRTPVDQGGGRMMGDGCTAFVLAVCQDYAWSGDRAFLADLWPRVRAALHWQIARSVRFGLPERLNNTYDWWAFEEKDVVAYNAFLHLAALRAGEELARAVGDDECATACRAAGERGRAAAVDLLWTGAHFRAWWMADGSHPQALHADTLYGQLWSWLLGLGDLVDPSLVRQHLRCEQRRNGGPFGLRVMQGAGCDDDRHPEVRPGFAPYAGGPVNNLVWEAGSLDWCALALLCGEPVEASLAEAERIARKWQEELRDPWDIRDLTTGWDGHPWCNSHYGRQLVAWAIPLALSGQQYRAPEGRLTFAPRVAPPARLPFFTPAAHGVLEWETEHQGRVAVFDGELSLQEPPCLSWRGRQVELLEGR